MARLYLFAEGGTEETFADTLLKRHLANHGVYLARYRSDRTGQEKGKGSPGRRTQLRADEE